MMLGDSPPARLRRMNAIDMNGIVSSPETPKRAMKVAIKELGVKGTTVGNKTKGGKFGSGSSSSKSSPSTSPKSPETPKNKQKVMKTIMKKSPTPTKVKSVMKAMKKLVVSKKRPAASGNHACNIRRDPDEKMFHDAMCEARIEYEDMVGYNKSFQCPPACSWRVCPGFNGLTVWYDDDSTRDTHEDVQTA